MCDPRGWTRGSGITLALVAGLAAAACGGSGGSTPAPSPTPSPGSTTITITASGVSPNDVTVAPGSRITFVNNDSRNHDMASDPHPEHTQCPEINVGFIQPGQSGLTQNLNNRSTCGFHDHNQPSNTSLRGTIRIQ